jgi:hypothetical protein
MYLIYNSMVDGKKGCGEMKKNDRHRQAERRAVRERELSSEAIALGGGRGGQEFSPNLLVKNT